MIYRVLMKTGYCDTYFDFEEHRSLSKAPSEDMAVFFMKLASQAINKELSDKEMQLTLTLVPSDESSDNDDF